MKKCTFFFAICFAVLLNLVVLPKGQCQDPSVYTQFFVNPYVLNSSYAGADGQPSLSLLYRKQWMTISGAPAITHFSLHAPLRECVSGGVSVNNEVMGLYNNSTLLFSFAYRVPIADKALLRFGVSAGGSWNTVDMKKLETISDPALSALLQRNGSLAGNAGMSIQLNDINVGIALPAIFSPQYVSEDAFNVSEVKPFQAVTINASKRFYFNDNRNVFEPYALYYARPDLPSLFELGGIAHLNGVLWVGGSYKQDFGLSVLGGVKIKNVLAIGTSYSFQKKGTDELNSPSFEIVLNYLFGRRKRDVPAYSFVNTTRPKARKPSRDRADGVAKRHAESAVMPNRKNESEGTTGTQRDPGQQKPTSENEVSARKPKQESREAEGSEPEQELAQPEGEPLKDPAGEARAVEGSGNHEPAEFEENRGPDFRDAVQHVAAKSTEEPVPPLRSASSRHDYARRGHNASELEIGEYVVAGAFKSRENAKGFSDGLQELDYASRYGYVTEKDLWYVYIFKTTNFERAQREQARVSQIFLLRDAWLLTVQP